MCCSLVLSSAPMVVVVSFDGHGPFVCRCIDDTARCTLGAHFALTDSVLLVAHLVASDNTAPSIASLIHPQLSHHHHHPSLWRLAATVAALRR